MEFAGLSFDLETQSNTFLFECFYLLFQPLLIFDDSCLKSKTKLHVVNIDSSLYFEKGGAKYISMKIQF